MSLKFLDRLRRTIGFQLTLWYSGALILSSLLLFGLAYFLLASSLERRDRDGIGVRLRELEAQYRAEGLKGVQEGLAFQKRLGNKKPFFIRIASPGNATVLMAIPDEWAEFDLTALERAPGAATGRLLRLPARDDEAVLEVASMRLSDGTLLQVGKSTEERDSFLEGFRSTVAVVLFPVIVIGVTGGALLGRRTLRPIRELIHTVRVIESGTMEARVPTRQTGDELDELGLLFNRMLDRIAGLIRGMRGALDTVAHDLRTPMTRLRGIAEAALQSERGPDACRDALADCVEEADQLLTMLNTLMDISEAETGAMKLDLEAVNLAALVGDVVDLYREVAEEKGIGVSTRVPEALWVTADRNRVRQILANLLDNALKYTASGGRVEVRAHQQGETAVVSFKDTGIGMTPEELSRAWERLFRGDRSRSERGLGLGLSLVKAVVQAHTGHVEVSSAPGVGSVFTVHLPLTPATPR